MHAAFIHHQSDVKMTTKLVDISAGYKYTYGQLVMFLWTTV